MAAKTGRAKLMRQRIRHLNAALEAMSKERDKLQTELIIYMNREHRAVVESREADATGAKQ
ncbi:hypothetical protein LCGC14_2920310 [marine sediment metagenome]|uniref:Uncharacterized protein n=1 Tax=marine sediment metagenome TaxID=412755 RepID=A0A0F8XP20_9ZZZZ